MFFFIFRPMKGYHNDYYFFLVTPILQQYNVHCAIQLCIRSSLHISYIMLLVELPDFVRAQSTLFDYINFIYKFLIHIIQHFI